MKLQCQRDGLLLACQLVGVAVAGRTPLAILSNIKAIADNDRLILMATDREIGIRYVLQGVQIDLGGEAIFPFNRLVSILREASSDNIQIEADANRMMVTVGSSEYEMATENPAEFPDIPTFETPQSHELTAGVLRQMIRQTVFAAAKESTKYAMTGVLWEVDEDKARLVATDSKRLALIEGPAVVHGTVEKSGHTHLVPTKAMSLLEKNLNDADERVQVCLRPNEVLFQTEKATIYSRLVEGRFPPYKDIIPKKMNAKIPLPAQEFLAAVKQAAIMTEEESKRVRFEFEPGKLKLFAQGNATGRSKVELPLEFDGPALEINFDPSLLVEMLRVLEPEQEQIALELVDSTRPAVFRCGPHYLYLVMPLS
ncbi:DNA polymerase III subunit beta [Tuwongella immobilis]|uniref:Beta sliding clamp n=1 Tax=Tuwongella immobilis TaxID=692036 RepID=A0A6C2YGM6_9BACT|nr:DNA polymerase III subunit beta [Tuwongella immobilis]VIP00567.1 dna polymerase iii subunit beta : DNA polymerase III subunit beta OS=Singulisphaera acidiphila (strain ATCC BAA-1392 / DSM 18658 / VKM B-2454 / MOB10) GN=Sinac_0120 PE=4 SV=1: DNA_pol3_beta: DNA_pol3_beta_2: DNA_pol3_beta_3 [Tuwongella immobilis]VTR96552.1 dna polymerase iii subunit beta : DNA polymerase III subunit beta OS=Singulisphaera acidiphila (strain ATCC BAA-1392 / DSM 18658 / VKM B-2454 / MOB10) GN=Sinac_0120 PE=4 SV=1: 